MLQRTASTTGKPVLVERLALLVLVVGQRVGRTSSVRSSPPSRSRAAVGGSLVLGVRDVRKSPPAA